MDTAFARALAAGAAAIHAADPDAVSAIEGVQNPGWGGYDYARLARSVDLIEVYDYDDNIELLRSLNPKLVLLTTSFLSGPPAAYRIWRQLLRGTRGLILWDQHNGFVGKDGNLGERGREAAPYFAEIRDGLGQLLINSRRHLDPVGVLYSPASMRVQWMLDHKSGTEKAGMTAAREPPGAAPGISSRNFVRAVQHLGLEPRFVSDEEIAKGGLRRAGLRAPDAAGRGRLVGPGGQPDPRLRGAGRHRRRRRRAGPVRRARAQGGNALAPGGVRAPARRPGGAFCIRRGCRRLRRFQRGRPGRRPRARRRPSCRRRGQAHLPGRARRRPAGKRHRDPCLRQRQGADPRVAARLCRDQPWRPGSRQRHPAPPLFCLRPAGPPRSRRDRPGAARCRLGRAGDPGLVADTARRTRDRRPGHRPARRYDRISHSGEFAGRAGSRPSRRHRPGGPHRAALFRKHAGPPRCGGEAAAPRLQRQVGDLENPRDRIAQRPDRDRRAQCPSPAIRRRRRAPARRRRARESAAPPRRGSPPRRARRAARR